MNPFKPNETMLNNYIQNKLSDTETEKMELWLVDHPEAMDDLELGVMFKQADFYPNNIPENVTTKKRNWLDRLFPKPALVFLHAAVFAFGMFLINLMVDDTNTNSVATFIELEKQRGLDTSVIEVQAYNNQSLVLRIFPDSMTEEYSLVMQSKSSNQRFEFLGLVADDIGSITVSINNKENIVGGWEVLLVDNTNKLEQDYMIEFD